MQVIRTEIKLQCQDCHDLIFCSQKVKRERQTEEVKGVTQAGRGMTEKNHKQQ